MAKNRVTSVDVARAAGVSQSAVSRALTQGASVSHKTRDTIFDDIIDDPALEPVMRLLPGRLVARSSACLPAEVFG